MRRCAITMTDSSLAERVPLGRGRARDWARRRLRPELCGGACLGLPELRLQLLDLGMRVFLVLLEAGLLQFLAGLSLGLPLRLLRRSDLLFDIDDRTAHDLATQPRHRG